MRFRLVVDGETHSIEVDRGAGRLSIRVDGAEYRASSVQSNGEFVVRVGRRMHHIRFEGQLAIVDGVAQVMSIPDVADVSRDRTVETVARGAAIIEVRPPMPGRIVRLAVAPGDRVSRGQTLAVLEAMKMQNEIPAPRDGVVRSVGVAEGESITEDRVVVVLESR